MAYLHPAEDITKMLTLNTIVPFFSDIKRIEVILGNLLINAVSYRSHDRELIIGVEVSTSDDDVVIVIKDNGIGIKEEVLPKIYNMFYRGTEASQGAGLGLYIVKEIVEKLSGKITITSMAGIGTTVTVTIPSEQMLKRRERERTIPVLKIHRSQDMASPGQWIMS